MYLVYQKNKELQHKTGSPVNLSMNNKQPILLSKQSTFFFIYLLIFHTVRLLKCRMFHGGPSSLSSLTETFTCIKNMVITGHKFPNKICTPRLSFKLALKGIYFMFLVYLHYFTKSFHYLWQLCVVRWNY